MANDAPTNQQAATTAQTTTATGTTERRRSVSLPSKPYMVHYDNSVWLQSVQRYDDFMKLNANKDNAKDGTAYAHLKDAKTSKPGVFGSFWSK